MKNVVCKAISKKYINCEVSVTEMDYRIREIMCGKKKTIAYILSCVWKMYIYIGVYVLDYTSGIYVCAVHARKALLFDQKGVISFHMYQNS